MKKCRCKNPLGIGWLATLALGVVGGVALTKGYETWAANQPAPLPPSPTPNVIPPPGV